MTQLLTELDNFDSNQDRTRLTPDRLKIFYDFLENGDYQKLFVWCCFQTMELMWSYDGPPNYYEAGKNLISSSD